MRSLLQQQSNAPSKNTKKIISKPTSAPPKGVAPAPPKGNHNTANLPSNAEQNRSLTVMIPRAKYYSQQLAGNMPADLPPPPQQQLQHQHQDR